MKAITVIEREDGGVYVAMSGADGPDEMIGLLHRGIDVTVHVESWKLAKVDHGSERSDTR